MTKYWDVEIGFKRAKNAALIAGLPAHKLELRKGSRSKGAQHCVTGPEPGTVRYIGKSYRDAVKWLSGYAEALEAIGRQAERERRARKRKMAGNPVVAARGPAEDASVVRLGDHFEADAR